MQYINYSVNSIYTAPLPVDGASVTTNLSKQSEGQYLIVLSIPKVYNSADCDGSFSPCI